MAAVISRPLEAALTAALGELRNVFGARLSTGESVRDLHGRAEASALYQPPDAVCWPLDTAEVSAALTVCSRYCLPVVAYGTGTSLEGQILAPCGGLTLNLSRMDAVLAVRPEDAECVVQPGVTREQLNAYLRDSGLFFPVDPGANASLGGMTATRASGTTTIRYGGMNQNVLALQAVLADGRVIRCGTRARKSSAGYDLVHLFTGSEGTLGIITELTLKLHPQPEAVGSATCGFDSIQSAVDAVVQMIQSGVPLARMEFLDEVAVRACNQASGLGLAEQPVLFLEIHGSPATVGEQLAAAQEICSANGGSRFAFATDPEQRSRLWKARHQAYFSAMALRPGSQVLVADVCVPVSQLAQSVVQARDAIDAAGLQAPILGHVGDGNYHVLFLLDPASDDERARAAQVYDRMIDDAQRCGGTCTGEHGIGIGKRSKLLAEYGEDVVGLMRAIKTAWDPQGILNPGKIFL